ncbi:DNA binding protein [Arthrobacter phage TripleJ]|uniref:DNA binding protein n=1 Tax=Arthrobacter phage TripleJ TaxID=2599838 RepID=A0A5J6TI29_9CAUD|nr:DNA binding protein [Arthrobacter phage TripleJ]QFG09577.1 DNA binding protein [Arthrobacter phage TripleJ]
MPVTCPACATTFASSLNIAVGNGIEVRSARVTGDSPFRDTCPNCGTSVMVGGEWAVLREGVESVFALKRGEMIIVQHALDAAITHEDLVRAIRVMEDIEGPRLSVVLEWLRNAGSNATVLDWIAIVLAAVSLATQSLPDDEAKMTPAQYEEFVTRVVKEIRSPAPEPAQQTRAQR